MAWAPAGSAARAGALVRHTIVRLRLLRLIALIDRENTASIRTAEKVGFNFAREVEVDGTKAQLYSLGAGPQSA
jgi:RimJ/RimL family protein N-acetyltransferase